MTLRDVAGCLVSSKGLVNRFWDIFIGNLQGHEHKVVFTNNAEKWQLRLRTQYSQTFVVTFVLYLDAPKRK